MGFVNAHYISYITGMGKDTLVASYALATVGITSIIGAIIFGYIADRYNSRYTLAVSYGFRTIGYILLLVGGSFKMAVIGVMFIGMSWTSVISLTGSVSSQYFGLKKLGTIYGTMFGVMPFGASAGVWVAGKVFDMNGSYDFALWLSMIMALGATLLIGIPRFQKPLLSQSS